MTHTIPPGSPKSDRASRFGLELERAMRERRVGKRVLASTIGVSMSSLTFWRRGLILPRAETANRLADSLRWPRLASLSLELRTKRCLVDDVAFVDDSGSDNRRYCSPGCQRVAEKRRAGVTTDKRAWLAERRLVEHQRAVAAFCRACEPDGRCFNAGCELRPVSPLPLVERRDEVPVAIARPVNGIRAPGQQTASMQRVWAGYSPEERQVRIDRAAEASRRGRGLVRT